MRKAEALLWLVDSQKACSSVRWAPDPTAVDS